MRCYCACRRDSFSAPHGKISYRTRSWLSATELSNRCSQLSIERDLDTRHRRGHESYLYQLGGTPLGTLLTLHAHTLCYVAYMSINVSVRLDDALAERLRLRARAAGETLSERLRRYAEEGARREEHP